MTPDERIENARKRTRALLDKARKTNNHRDRVDRRNGFAPPDTGPPDDLLRTIMCAIQCGLETEDWDCVAEAYEMAIDLHLMMKGVRYDPARHVPPGGGDG